MAPAPAPEAQFKKDEKVLCFHHELLYDAKVLDVRSGDGENKKDGFEYKVHYKGWKNTWDDWVPEDRLRKITQENRDLANSLRQEMLAIQRAARAQPAPTTTKKKPQGSTRGSEERQTSVSAAPGPRGQKRLREQDLEKEETFQERSAVRIPMMDRLKSILVDDWELVSKKNELVTLPTKYPVGVILDEYFEAQKKSRKLASVESDILEEVVQGLKEYFNKALPRLLLFRFERGQLMDIQAEMDNPTSDLAGKNFTDIYSGQHLLRLLSKMPELLAHTNMDAHSMGRLREEITNLQSWLCKEPQVSRFFDTQYESAPQDYHDRAKSTA